jgi:hypothetical protein
LRSVGAEQPALGRLAADSPTLAFEGRTPSASGDRRSAAVALEAARVERPEQREPAAFRGSERRALAARVAVVARALRKQRALEGGERARDAGERERRGLAGERARDALTVGGERREPRHQPPRVGCHLVRG